MDERPEYVWGDQEAEKEFARLDGQTDLLDDVSRSRLSGLGLGPNARCLEIGPGTGSMMRWMVEQGWSVLELDISDRFFPGLVQGGVELRVGDIRDANLEGGYDLIFIRYVLHHLPERGAVVKKLAGLLRPGGWLVAEDPHIDLMKTLAGADVSAVYQELAPAFVKLGLNPNVGAHLPALFLEAGLQQVDAVGGFSLVFPGAWTVEFMQTSLGVVEDRMVPVTDYEVADFERFRSQVAADDFLGTTLVTISCKGKRAEL